MQKYLITNVIQNRDAIYVIKIQQYNTIKKKNSHEKLLI